MDKNNDILQEAIDARIDSFLRGEMTPDEESAFKQEIQADPELRAQVSRKKQSLLNTTIVVCIRCCNGHALLLLL